MDRIRVRTTQNVFIEYPIASLGDRMAAFLIDAVILTAYNGLCYYLLKDAEISVAVSALLFFLPFFLYHLLFEIFMNGQTPGKRQMRIKVVSLDGSSPSVGGYFMRWLFRLVEIFLLRGALAIMTIAASNKGQRLGDAAAGTTVVKLTPPEATASEKVFVQAEDAEGISFVEAGQLSDGDVELIHQVLTVFRETGNLRPVDELTAKLKEHLSVASDLAPVKFLYTLLKDHSTLVSAV